MLFQYVMLNTVKRCLKWTGFNRSTKKLTLLSGSRYFRGGRYYRNSTVLQELKKYPGKLVIAAVNLGAI